MSRLSPGPVADDETVARMVVIPMMVHKTRAEVVPAFFGHAVSRGLSVQRLETATAKELTNLVSGFLKDDPSRAWVGYVAAPVSNVRSVRREEDGERIFCVYDIANRQNPAHAEIAVSQDIPEADRVERRRDLMRAYDDGHVYTRSELMGGAVWKQLAEDLRQRPVSKQWSGHLAAQDAIAGSLN